MCTFERAFEIVFVLWGMNFEYKNVQRHVVEMDGVHTHMGGCITTPTYLEKRNMSI